MRLLLFLFFLWVILLLLFLGVLLLMDYILIDLVIGYYYILFVGIHVVLAVAHLAQHPLLSGDVLRSSSSSSVRVLQLARHVR